MDNEKPYPRRKAEEDAIRNTDSMMPVRKTSSTASESRSEALPKTRKQRRLEEKGLSAQDSAVIGHPADHDPLKQKAKAFSQMVCNDIDASTASSLSFLKEDNSRPKKGKRDKGAEDFTEGIDMEALDSRIEGLLSRFLRNQRE